MKSWYPRSITFPIDREFALHQKPTLRKALSVATRFPANEEPATQNAVSRLPTRPDGSRRAKKGLTNSGYCARLLK